MHAFYEKIKDLKPKRLPLADNQMHEQFKKRYNYKQAIKYKVAKLSCVLTLIFAELWSYHQE